ncbi:MAG: SDR family NAD(P)-dependent oxidoreductase [Rhodobacteraceae bacterium]|nr:SDR family NAD(P)-dependent oxidoreductase [Paracoccaceae bacterium]
MKNTPNSASDTAAEPMAFAIVGMSVDLPGAASLDAFWENLRDGVSSIRPLDEAALLAAGEDPAMIRNPDYVPVAALLDDYDRFDADVFGFSPKEAAILDPQHRKFLEVAWTALENAGHAPDGFPGRIGVYAGCGMGSYFYFNICSNPDMVQDVGMFLLRHTGNDKDFLSTRVSHVFDLKGPSINLQTACSTSLVAVHYACQALASGECEMALAGGVTIDLPQGRGYLYKENEILSPDGACRAFDHRAQGTVFGSGAGAIVIRRLQDAIADGDHIHAVIRGSAVNNDGAAKAGYLAPSVDGQATAVRAALDKAGVEAETLDYVECHGTGTYLGDPIEVSALTEAYRASTDATGFCRIGSVKTNIGHLDTAAGVAGLVKTALALQHRQIPPSLGFEAPNPAIDFDHSPFRVNAALADWTSHKGPRRAGVNALGVGGTNAHVILEEAPARAASEESDFPFHVLCVSGRTKSALDANTRALAAHLRAHPEQPLADVAHTLRNGRHGFERRRVVVAETHDEAARLLDEGDARSVFTHDVLGTSPDTVFMFPGGGAQYPDMARDLYETEPVFADWMDRGLAHLQPQLDYDIRALWLPEPQDRAAAAETLKKPSVQLPLIMIVEYALAQLWMSWGVRPSALVGHSMGENTAACLAGVMRFEDCIDLVLLRGRLFDTVPAGGMLSVSAPLAQIEPLVGDDLDIASVNAPQLSAVSGPQAALDRLAKVLTARGIDHQRVPIDIAAHSRMLDPILGDFRAFLQKLTLSPPELTVMSNRTGRALTDEQATDPDYWVAQLRNTVMFADCISTLAQRSGQVFLEVGPGKALSALAQMSETVKPGQVLSSLRHPDQDIADDAYFLGVIGRLWACGVNADWSQIWGEARRNRVPLPGYQFQRSRYFIEPGTAQAPVAPRIPVRSDDIADWGWRPAWYPKSPETDLEVGAPPESTPPETWLVFADQAGLADATAARLRRAGHDVTLVRSGDSFAELSDGSFVLAPEQGRDGYDMLFLRLAELSRMPTRIAHFWLVTETETFRPGSSFFYRNAEHGFYSLMYLAQALSTQETEADLHITVVTNGAAQVGDEPLPYPEKALIAGPAGVIPREMPGLTCATIDIDLPQRVAETGFWAELRAARQGPRPRADLEPFAERLLEDLLARPRSATAALRNGRRLEQNWRAAPLTDDADDDAPLFRNGGTYLVTGGFGGIGLTVARDLIEKHAAKIVLVVREALPDRAEWAAYLAGHAPGDRTARRIRAVQGLEAAGGDVMLAVADVCNIEEMRHATDAVRARFGRIDGVLHAAGVIDDGPLLARTADDVERVFAPKITGLHVLDEIFPDGALDLMVLFSSSSTATRPAGQIDYVAANEYLNAFARSRRSAQTRVVAINWGIWAQVGMAAEAMARRTGDTEPAPHRPVDAPLLDTTSFDATGVRTFHASLGTDHWLLDDHRTRAGDAVIPGTGYAELAAEALGAQGVTVPYEIRDLYFLRPVGATADAPAQITLRLEDTDDGFGFEVRSGVMVNGRPGTVLNAQAQLHLLHDSPRPGYVDPGAIARRCGASRSAGADGRLRSPQEAHLDFGPRWDVIRSIALGRDEGLAHLALPPAARDDLAQGYVMHPALMDLATGWAMDLIPGYKGAHLWVPLSYRSIRVWRPLPSEVLSWVRLNPAGGDGMASFDITLCGRDGTVYLEAQGFEMKRMQGAFAAPGLPEARDVIFDDARRSDTPLSPDEERLVAAIAEGIRPAEGPDALRRALRTGHAQIVVSALPLPALIAQADAPQTAPTESQSFERPDLDSDFVAPRNPVEETLAGFWQNLLGVAQVGVHDSFFDLGGHSLIAVRLFAMIKRSFDVQLPISVLFEAPTIAKCADLIAARTGRSLDAKPAATRDKGDAAAPPPEPFAHVVPLHPGPGTGATPFFIVAGMFGNVLNLRHLALLIGKDRPVYGLQARGLVGDDAPHDRVEEAAEDYIAEMRRVQPDGPYLLGGFSGGGITAYEMAQQITRAGQTVAVLAMLDTPLPVRPALRPMDRLWIKWQDLRQQGLGFFGKWARDRLAWEVHKRQANTAPHAVGGFNNARIEAAFMEAMMHYNLRKWDGDMILFRPALDRHWQVSGGNWANRDREYVFHDNAWSDWISRISVVEVPGDHDSMVLVPNVSVMASHLAEVFDAAEPEQSPAPLRAVTAAE